MRRMRSLLLLMSTVLLAASAAAQLGAPVPLGTGPGFHDPNSQFAPLPARSDVVPWSLLTAVKTKVANNKVLPAFDQPFLALNHKTQRVQGFMMPIEPGDRHSHFLLSAVPLSCPFCVPGGPESMVEVKTKTPVRYTLEPVTVEGTFALLENDDYGMYYRITDAVGVK